MSKFESPRDEVLYQISLDGTDRAIGDVSTWGGFYSGIGKLLRADLESTYSNELAEAGASLSDFTEDTYWILREDGSGLVTVYEYSSEREYREALDRIEAEYSIFLDGAA
ncbi:hypothetical protein ACT17_32635 [Mycolicibacterium conceptionense]|uniref:Uncharacterized protein n=1 Tax=Mycolicibacterium conceptionense TaxID=451644 RepID=A0A0J8U075_9MYCO|nr:hypothetical protein [Mycolicibacterium conceptionense]KMV13930.1 hypothetical protein ACT17_32635 [Mycolicibacterium conceptionense]